MVFAPRDDFDVGLPIPSGTSPPVQASALYASITPRLIDGSNAPAGIAQYLRWDGRSGPDHRILWCERRVVVAVAIED
jgi:hypothetical protein